MTVPPTRPPRLRATAATARVAVDLLRTLFVPPRTDAAPRRGFDPRGDLRIRPAPSGPASRELVVVSWNIHRFYDPDGVSRGLDRIRRELDPDLLLLQEVPWDDERPFWERPGPAEVLEGMALAWAPMHRVLERDPYYRFEASGQLTASRAGLESPRVVPLPPASRAKLGPRHRFCRIGLISVVPVADGGSLPVVNLHLENTARPGGRGRQLDHLLSRLEAGPAVVAGDLNTLFGGLESAWRVAARHGFDRVAVAGRRAFAPRLDHVLVRGAVSSGGRELPTGGSDHRPLVVTVTLPGPAGYSR